MAFVKIAIHRIDLEPKKRLFKQRFPGEFRYLIQFLKLLSLGEINKGKSVGERRQAKHIYLLSVFFRHVQKKPVTQFTKKDMQQFIDRLNKNKVCKRNKEPYSDSMKQDIKISLRTYLKWRLPNKYSQLTDWFDTRLKKTTPEYLSENEVEKLFNACSTVAERFLICVLFDSGLRAEEFLNIRFEDMIDPTESFPYYKIDVKEEYSKTDGRTLGLYWKHSGRTVREYLAQCDGKAKDPVYKKDYDAIRMFLTRLGRRVLKKRVHFHLFRKSSATYYAPKLNRQQLCVRYGWKFSSDMPDVYIKRAGIEEEQVKDKILNTNLQKLENENQELQSKFALLKDSNDKEIRELKSQFQDLMEGRGFMKLLKSLADQEKQRADGLATKPGRGFDVVIPKARAPRRGVR